MFENWKWKLISIIRTCSFNSILAIVFRKWLWYGLTSLCYSVDRKSRAVQVDTRNKSCVLSGCLTCCNARGIFYIILSEKFFKIVLIWIVSLTLFLPFLIDFIFFDCFYSIWLCISNNCLLNLFLFL